MSLVLIPVHDETIFDIAKKDTKFQIDDGAFEDEEADKTRKQGQTKSAKCALRPHATMGIAQHKLPDPSNFLKKGKGKQKPPRCELKGPKHQCQRRPVLPKPRSPRQSGAKVNFIAKNIKKAINMTPKEPVPRIVFHASGASKPKQYYVRSEEYGQVPKYLVKLKSNAEVKRLREKETFALKQPLCRYITSDERESLLEGLKENWEELQIIYQGLPIFTDTIPKINKKVKLENALKQLEGDIVLVEKHPFIYVYKDMTEEK